MNKKKKKKWKQRWKNTSQPINLKKIKITWHKDEKEGHSLRSKIVFIKDAAGKYSGGRWHLQGLDALNPQKFISFYSKEALKLWSKAHKYKIVKYKVWKRKVQKRLKKRGLKWQKPRPPISCPKCQTDLRNHLSQLGLKLVESNSKN